MGFSRHEYQSGLPFLPPGDLPNPGIETTSLTSPVLAGGFFNTSATWEVPISNHMFAYTYIYIYTYTHTTHIHTQTHTVTYLFVKTEKREIHYKQLAHAILEAGEYQDLQGELSARDPREPMVWLQPKSEGLRTCRVSDVSSSQTASRL